MGAAPEAGTLLLGKLRIEEVLGEGGMGVVCKAHHLHLDQPVAIKFLLAQMIENPAVVARFLREAQASVRLRNEHVARVIDVGRLDDGAPYMVMEYLEGADLGAIIKYYGAQEPEIAADLLIQACEGIAEAHAIGIIHRDLKPSNFFITRRPDGTPLLKILDFGISTAPKSFESELTRTSSVIGTPAYMAPEQMRSARNADHRSDLWSMGVVLYQTITGRQPFESEAYSEMCLKVGMDPPAPIDAGISPAYETVILRCLEKNPDHRFQNVAELAWELVPFATDPALARGSAERASRILGIKVSGPVPVQRISGEHSVPAITPMPVVRAARASKPYVPVPDLVEDAPTDATAEPVLPKLSAGRMERAETVPRLGKASPTSVTGGAGQISISRSMLAAAPSRRGWVIGSLAVAAVGIGGWLAIRPSDPEVAPDPAPHSATGGPATPVETAPAPAPAPAVTPPPVPEPVAAPAAGDEPVADEPAADEPVADEPVAKPKSTPKRSRSRGKSRTKDRAPAATGGVFDQRE